MSIALYRFAAEHARSRGIYARKHHGRAGERTVQALRAIGEADSVALDPHKTLFLPYGTGADGRMREDFFYRINVVPIRIPPLRERVEDIPDLVSHFLAADFEGRKLTTDEILVTTAGSEAPSPARKNWITTPARNTKARTRWARGRRSGGLGAGKGRFQPADMRDRPRRAAGSARAGRRGGRRARSVCGDADARDDGAVHRRVLRPRLRAPAGGHRLSHRHGWSRLRHAGRCALARTAPRARGGPHRGFDRAGLQPPDERSHV